MKAQEADGTSRGLNRRAFLRGAGVAASLTLASAAGLRWTQTAAAGDAPDGDGSEIGPPAMLIDLTRCVGCNSCALACKAKNGLPDAELAPDGLDSAAYTYVATVDTRPQSGGGLRHVKRQCMHCLEPACVAACPAAAMFKSPEGPVVYRPNRCLGCRYCQLACPFGVPAFDWKNPITPRISKCWFCHDRQLQGERPACVEACPTGALHFGGRNVLLAEAHGCIASMPGRYVDHVFGEFELGGTSMLYLSDVPFEELGFPADLGEEAPAVQSEKVMRALPAVILGVGALAAGTAAYSHRAAPARPAGDDGRRAGDGSNQTAKKE